MYFRCWPGRLLYSIFIHIHAQAQPVSLVICCSPRPNSCPASCTVQQTRDRMEQVKTLFATHPHTLHDKHARSSHDEHKDKLEQTKLREKALKESAKSERDSKKNEKEEARLAAAAAFRMDRAYSGQSKRAAKDAREAEKKEHRHEEGERIGECEHGVWRCKICNPVTKHK